MACGFAPGYAQWNAAGGRLVIGIGLVDAEGSGGHQQARIRLPLHANFRLLALECGQHLTSIDELGGAVRHGFQFHALTPGCVQHGAGYG